MFKNNIRPYELSVWTLQDGFITVLKGIGLENKGQIMTPKSSIKNDGTQELFFSIPMYYRENGVLVENPNWYNTRNGILLINLRKIKVIFNKGEDGEEVFEFVINKITETHKDGQMYCEVTAEGLAFQELGKIGYKKSLTSADFYADYEDWYEKGANSRTEPKPSLRYWCDKVFNNSNWTYLIEMDSSSYDGIIVENISVESSQNNKTYTGPYKDAPAWAREKFNDERESSSLRRLDTVYEEDYVSSWDENLIPKEIKPFEEKYRLPEIEKSNIYNITQTLAESFGVYCKYRYRYDKNYHIIRRECVFYNQYFEEKEDALDFTYPYHTSEISREIDSADVITKMFVVPIEDDTLLNGQISIAEELANPSYEDYVMNFDYLYSIGTITKEQYDEIPVYEKEVRNLNLQLESCATVIADLEEKIVEYSAKQKILQEQITLDKNQISQSNALLNSLTNGTGEIEVTLDNPYKTVLLPENGRETYYLKITKEGVLYNKTLTIYYLTALDSKDYTPYEEEAPNLKLVLNKEGFVTGITGIVKPEKMYSNSVYLTFTYSPQLQYEAVKEKYEERLRKDSLEEVRYSSLLSRAKNDLSDRKANYQNLLANKEKAVSAFEKLMGTAIREGSWQPESYSDYGTKWTEEVKIGGKSSSGNLHFIYDTEAFTGEQLAYIGENDSANYYSYVSLKDILEDLGKCDRESLSRLSLQYTDSENGEKKYEYLQIGSQIVYGFIKNDNSIEPIIIITDTGYEEKTFKIGILTPSTSTSENKGADFTEISTISLTSKKFSSSDMLCYPRIEINKANLKTSEDELKISFNNVPLTKYYDYSVLIRDRTFYITPDVTFILYYIAKSASGTSLSEHFTINYTLSNASLALYLDSLSVLKNNAFPKTSYTISVSALNKELMKYLYNKLNKIVNINDTELKFKNVKGYISEIEMNLDEPWEDEVKVQNYKTKFEDLFSSIIASTEQMKYNSFSYGIAGGAFTSSGTLKPSVIQSTLNRVDLSLAFNSGNLTIDEINGIWATSDEGVVAMKGGGIFCATEKDSYGNWNWTTGITPSGINASLLNAGQIDTNLIRIYGGNNLRFMLTADGLFAYGLKENNQEDFNSFVVHNSDGLFLTKKGLTILDDNGTNLENQTVNQVEVSWNGLIIRDINTGNSVFYADEEGNLNLEGFITAKGGTIGGWDITENALVSGSQFGKISLQAAPEKDENGEYTAAAYDAITITKTILEGTGDNITSKEETIFSVSSEGLLTANNAYIKGKIVANNTVQIGTDKLVANNAIMDFNGVEFGIYNRNLDGNLTYSPYSLDFVLIADYSDIENLTLKIDDGDNLILEKTIEALIANNDNIKPEWLSISGDLTFNITYGIIAQTEADKINISFFDSGLLIAKKEIFIKRYNVDKKFELTPVISYFTEKEEDDDTREIQVETTDINAESIKYFFNGKENIPQEITISNNIIVVKKSYFTNNDVPTTLSIQVVLTLDGVTYTRNASVSLTKNGISAGLYSVIITSTEGEIFKNGQIQTSLTANLYKGAELLNGGNDTTYGYLWFKGGEVLKGIDNNDDEILDREFLNQKTINIENNDFFNKEIYECEIYATAEEAQAEYEALTESGE